jgi:hypothetical protein
LPLRIRCRRRRSVAATSFPLPPPSLSSRRRVDGDALGACVGGSVGGCCDGVPLGAGPGLVDDAAGGRLSPLNTLVSGRPRADEQQNQDRGRDAGEDVRALERRGAGRPAWAPLGARTGPGG